MRFVMVSVDEKSLRGELPGFLEFLGDVAGWVGALDLAKTADVPAEVLADLRDGLVRTLGFLHGLFTLRGEPPPEPQPGIAFRSLGPSLKRTLPQRLAAQLEDELNAVPGTRLEDVSQFTALGLFSRVSDLLRFVGFLEEERIAALRRRAPSTVVSARVPRGRPPKSATEVRPPASAGPAARPKTATAPPPDPAPARVPVPAEPVPSGPGPDLSAYDIRIDEAGERIDVPGASVWFASGPGPGAVGGGLAASFAVPFANGVALAVAEGAESSLGARLAAVVAARAFCRAAAASPHQPEAAVRAAQSHLDMLLSALLTAGDASDALARVRGNVAPANARRILRHTRQPEEALRRVAPALATSLVGAVAVSGGGRVRVSVARLGALGAQVRAGGRVTTLLGAPRPGTVPFLAPGARGGEEVNRMELAPPLELGPAEALLLGSSALGRGAPGPWDALATLWAPFPDGLAAGDSARELLRRAERWGEAEPPHFGGPLGLALLLAR
jgi:hypothetical protein